MGILRYLVRRLLFSVVLVLGVSAIIFFLLNAIGNPIDVLMADNPGITDEALAAVKAYYHLDASVGHRYLIWLGNVARLDFGTSITTNHAGRRHAADLGRRDAEAADPGDHSGAAAVDRLRRRSPRCASTAGWISA